MHRVQSQPAFVLHRRPYRNTSLLLEVFSRDFGRLGLVARGARGARHGPILQPFTALRMDWTLRDDLGGMGAVESERAAPALGGEALICGFYLNELLYRLCHRHDPHPGLFEAYAGALPALAGGPVEPVLRRFEYRLLVELGYAPLLDRTADTGEPVVAGQDYRYLPEQGPVALGGSRREPGAVFSGRSLLALEHNELDADPALLGEVRDLMRLCLAPLLGAKPLRSRELYRSMKNLGKRHASDCPD